MAQRDNIDLQRQQAEAHALALEERLKATVTERDRYVVDLAQLRLRYQALLLDREAVEAEAQQLREPASKYPLVEAQLEIVERQLSIVGTQLEEALQTVADQAATIRRLELAEAQLGEALQTLNDQAETIRQIHASRSWRITAPYRAAVVWLQRALGRQT